MEASTTTDVVEPSAAPAARRRWLRYSVLFVALVGALAAGYRAVVMFVLFNYHTVIPGQIYRSSQPSPGFLEKVARTDGLKAILKLNSPKDGQWSSDEKAEAQQMGLQLVNCPLADRRWPTRAEMIRLMDALMTTPRPFLLHCKSGADRASVASVIAAMQNGQSFDEAMQTEIGVQFLHFGYPGADIAEVFDWYQKYCRNHALATGGYAEFRRYIEQDYDPPRM